MHIQTYFFIQAAAKTFFQLLTIHVILSICSSAPRIWALLPRKDGQTYVRLMNILKNLCGALDPRWIVVDFEIAQYQGFLEIFPDALIGFCLFHFGKNFFDQIDDLGLAKRYNTDDDFYRVVNGLKALAFLRPQDVIKAYELILKRTDEEGNPYICEKLRKYMDRQYIGIKKTERSRVRTAPIYAIERWSVHQVGSLFIIF